MVTDLGKTPRRVGRGGQEAAASGFLSHCAGVGWIYWMGLRMIRAGGVLRTVMLPTLVGLSCFLIATGTNPYLARFDGLWVVCLPLALINFWVLRQDPAPWHAASG